ncbi:hypothetical protein [Escherichia coli]|uniref:hypothetical protein n=1 Tax=Escherichia coli TaxID=562 RepID=UPI000541F1E7|nr:hypothetical protein [Escherichia coli]KHI93878.1 hypothetical protein PU12_19045 [Escherichia coli]
MNKDVIELLEQLNKAAEYILADVKVLDGHLLLASKSATQEGRDRAVELYVQDAAHLINKWLPDVGVEVTNYAEATAAHMVLMHLAIDSYRSNMLAMLDFMKAKN